MFNKKISPQVSHEYILVIVICIVAACRIFIFNAAFPLFNNVDEEYHFDLVYKYSNGQLPQVEVENFGRETAELILLCGTYEYLSKAEQSPKDTVPYLLRAYPNIRESSEFAKALAVQQNYKN